MRALTEEFLLRHLNDGAIGGLLLRLDIAAVFLALDALCGRIIDHRDRPGDWELGVLVMEAEVSKCRSVEIEKILPADWAPLLLQRSA
jgi:hypothetical protein